MTRRIAGHSTPGYGDRARVVSSTSGKEWIGEVLVWGSTGEPFLRDEETAETRWFPPSWVAEVTDGPGPGPCSCKESGETGPQGEVFAETNPECPQHGDPATIATAILQRARSRA